MKSRDRAARSNTASMEKAVDRLDSLLRKATLKEPRRGFEDLVNRTRLTLDRLKERTEEARRILERVEEKELDDRTMLAETLAPSLVVAFSEAFMEMFERARSGDAYPLRRINIAASILLGQIDSGNFLVESSYPEGESKAKDAIVESRISIVRETYKDVCLALDSMHESLGVQLPSLENV